MTDDTQRLSRQLGLKFNNPALLVNALTHRSASGTNNERLEFLGDGALNFIIASALYERKPECDEGSLSRLRANLVRGVTLSEIARDLKLGDYLNLGTGELKSGGFRRDSILADAVEAIIGAVYLDAGFAACQAFVLRLFKTRLDNLPEPEELVDPKTRLQEYLQGHQLPLPNYNTLQVSGKSHAQTFLVECAIPALGQRTEATASSRRKGEQAAARAMLDIVLSLSPKPIDSKGP
ncbi:ribonuclease III [Granulosicoccaceae sp. 1_MG-2023]|nr:ribonuclease III [Granulosicoccaceae sp. 1_MG-2023]